MRATCASLANGTVPLAAETEVRRGLDDIRKSSRSVRLWFRLLEGRRPGLPRLIPGRGHHRTGCGYRLEASRWLQAPGFRLQVGGWLLAEAWILEPEAGVARRRGL